MFRREVGASKDVLPSEIQEIWDAIRRLRSSINASILPEGMVWGEDSNGDLLIIQDGVVIKRIKYDIVS